MAYALWGRGEDPRKEIPPVTTLFARARAYQPLTPAERATLKLLEGLFSVALVAALPVVADALGRQSVNWTDIARTALAAAAVAVLLALSKYAKAHGDPALGATLDTAATDLSRAAGRSDPDDSPISPAPTADATANAQPVSAASSPVAEGTAG